MPKWRESQERLSREMLRLAIRVSTTSAACLNFSSNFHRILLSEIYWHLKLEFEFASIASPLRGCPGQDRDFQEFMLKWRESQERVSRQMLRLAIRVITTTAACLNFSSNFHRILLPEVPYHHRKPRAEGNFKPTITNMLKTGMTTL